MARSRPKSVWDLSSSDFPPADPSGDVDLEQLDFNLSLTPDQRMQQYMRWLEVVEAARQAGRDYYGMEPRPAGIIG
ncbi:MAG TPA: hypothetical protein VG722_09240 [Tepidisphaeraceae bacterium]|nr:hypothetical protein [Tepidisphaeraceae bacterium]